MCVHSTCGHVHDRQIVSSLKDTCSSAASASASASALSSNRRSVVAAWDARETYTEGARIGKGARPWKALKQEFSQTEGAHIRKMLVYGRHLRRSTFRNFCSLRRRGSRSTPCYATHAHAHSTRAHAVAPRARCSVMCARLRAQRWLRTCQCLLKARDAESSIREQHVSGR